MSTRPDPDITPRRMDADMADYSDPAGDDFVALASEEVAIRAIIPQEIDTYDPYDEEVRVWQA